jgi:ribosomal RNA-processing protein 1
MWMSDKPRTQQQLARDLAGLVDTLPEQTVLPFLDAFWITMSREWVGIDALRFVWLHRTEFVVRS